MSEVYLEHSQTFMINIFCEYKAFPANTYLFKFSDRNTRKTCEISSKLTVKTPERRH